MLKLNKSVQLKARKRLRDSAKVLQEAKEAGIPLSPIMERTLQNHGPKSTLRSNKPQ